MLTAHRAAGRHAATCEPRRRGSASSCYPHPVRLTRQQVPSTGLLRVAVLTTFSRLRLVGQLPDFLRLHSDIHLDITYSDRHVDIVRDRIDVAIRIGRLKNTGRRARLLNLNTRRLLAAPEYPKSSQPVEKPEDPSRHRFSHFSHLKGGDVWVLEPDGIEHSVPLDPWLRSEDTLVLHDSAKARPVIAIPADFVAATGLQDGSLAPLAKCRVPDTGSYAFHAGSSPPPKTRAFVDLRVDGANS